MMKRTKIFLAMVAIFLAACKKGKVETQPLATLNVANVVLDGKIAKLNDYYTDNCASMGTKIFTFKSGTARQIRFWPNDAPDLSYFNETKDIELGGLYSIFLTGTAAAPESVFVKDNIPPYPTTDVINIRLANMSPGTGNLSLNLTATPTVNLFNGVGYKQVADFISLPLVTTPATAVAFQIRNAAGTVIGTYTLPASGTVSVTSSKRRNVTFVVKGMVGGTGAKAFAILPMVNY